MGKRRKAEVERFTPVNDETKRCYVNTLGFIGELKLDPDGSCVRYEDYEKLEAERDRWMACCDEAAADADQARKQVLDEVREGLLGYDRTPAERLPGLLVDRLMDLLPENPPVTTIQQIELEMQREVETVLDLLLHPDQSKGDQQPALSEGEDNYERCERELGEVNDASDRGIKPYISSRPAATDSLGIPWDLERVKRQCLELQHEDSALSGGVGSGAVAAHETPEARILDALDAAGIVNGEEVEADAGEIIEAIREFASRCAGGGDLKEALDQIESVAGEPYHGGEAELRTQVLDAVASLRRSGGVGGGAEWECCNCAKTAPAGTIYWWEPPEPEKEGRLCGDCADWTETEKAAICLRHNGFEGIAGFPTGAAAGKLPSQQPAPPPQAVQGEAESGEREYMSGGQPGGTCHCGRTPDPGIKPEGGCWCSDVDDFDCQPEKGGEDGE